MSKRISHRVNETGEEVKWCSGCHEWLPLAQYSKHVSMWDGLQPRCKKCAAQYYAAHIEEERRRHKEYRTTHAEEIRQQKKEYRATHAEEIKWHRKEYYTTHAENLRDEQLRRNFGLSRAQYDALFAVQGGVCLICGKPPNGKRALVVDHNHETGVIRGLLCDRCNMGMGYFDDNTSLLRAAIDYLEKEEE